MKIEVNKCDNADCKRIIRQEDVEKNQVKIYIGDNPHFIGELCGEHIAELHGAIIGNQKVVKS